MKIIVTDKVSWFKAAAITIYPFIFIAEKYKDRKDIIKHEMIHIQQQETWAICGLGIGLLLWFFLYQFCLPVGWNPFRYKWEYEAYKNGSGYTDEQIKQIMKKAPYYLWLQ